jgi:hypothetical protein
LDFDRAFEFLTQNQAELSAKIGVITDNLTVQGTLLARLETIVKENAEQISRHTQQIGVIQEAIVALVASDQRLQEKFDATDERVNTLINTVERLIDRQNGRSEGR